MKTQNSKLKTQNYNSKFKNKKSFDFSFFTFNFRRSRIGFTLIEILIAVTILAILMSLSFAGYSKLNQRQKLVTAGETLKSLLRDAQSRAFNKEVDCNVCTCSLGGSSSLIGWYADFSATERKIYGECQGDIIFGEKSFGLSDEIVIGVVPVNANPLLFRYNPPSTDNDVTICLNLQNDANNYYLIRVNRAGSVSDAGDLVGACP